MARLAKRHHPRACCTSAALLRHHASCSHTATGRSLVLLRQRRSRVGKRPHARLPTFLQHQVTAVRAGVSERLQCGAAAAAIAAAAPAAAALAHCSHSSCRCSHSAFDGLDQPEWWRRLERDVFPTLRQGYSIDVPLSWEVRSRAGASGLSALVGGLPVTALDWLATSHLLPRFQEGEAVERIEKAGMSSTFAWAHQELKVLWDGLPRPSSAEVTACFQLCGRPTPPCTIVQSCPPPTPSSPAVPPQVLRPGVQHTGT